MRYRVIDDWNKLPDSIVLAENMDTFKNRLDRLWNDVVFSNPFD